MTLLHRSLLLHGQGTAEELAPTKQFLVVSVDDGNPVYVNYKKYEGRSNRGNPKYSDSRNLLQSLLNSVGALSDSSRQCA